MGSPVIFVHGIGASGLDWEKFDLPGHQSFYLSFSDRFGDPAKQVPELSKFIEEVLKKTKETKVVLVCHSMGGLVARKYLEDHKNDHAVEKLVLMSTPNLGTIALNWLPLCPAAWAMRPHSSFIRELNSQNLPTDVKYISVLSDTKYLPNRLVNLFIFREGGDGAVPLSSQRLSEKCVPNFADLDYSEIKIALPHFRVPVLCQKAVWQALGL